MLSTNELIAQSLVLCQCGTCLTCMMRDKLTMKEMRLRNLQDTCKAQAQAAEDDS